MTDDISEALHRAADLLPDTSDRLDGVRRKRTARVRRRMGVAAAVLVLVGGGTAYGLTRGGASQLVLPVDDGKELTATGIVVQPAGEGPRLCVPLPVDAMGGPQPIVRCPLGVDLKGVDLTALRSRREYQGGIAGFATITGQLEGDTLVVTQQTVDDTAGEDLTLAPDCPPPPGGWKAMSLQQNPWLGPMQRYESAHKDEVAEIAVARPTLHEGFPYVVVWGDPTAARAALAADYGDQFCVLQSRWTQEQVDAAFAEFGGGYADGVYERGGDRHIGHDGQLVIQAHAVRETPELDAIVARHPAGLIHIDYWLHPVGS